MGKIAACSVSAIDRGMKLMVVPLLVGLDPVFLYSEIDENDIPTK